MAAKKTKVQPAAAEAEVKPVEVTSPVVVEPPKETVIVPEQTPNPTTVKEGELASAIADLAQAVDSSQTKPVEEKIEFVPVGVSEEPQQPTENVKPAVKPRGSGGLWIGLAFLIGLGAGVLLGYWLWGRDGQSSAATKQEDEMTQNVSPTPALSETQAAPTGVVEIDRSKLKIQVLNGSGGKGVAAKAKADLESMGYEDVAVGNADREDYDQTEIAVLEENMAYFETLRADLASKYQVASQASTLSPDSSFDAVVTIGLK